MKQSMWPTEAGQIVHVDMDNDANGERVMRTVVTGSDYHQPDNTDLVIETIENDGLLCSFATVELSPCGTSRTTPKSVDSLLLDDMFCDIICVQIGQYLHDQWERLTGDTHLVPDRTPF